MHGSYNPYLVGLSLLVAMFASYAALDLAGRIRSISRVRKRWLWLTGGAVSMGIGIWAMHFIGMLAFRMPMELGYDVRITLCSLLIAILISGFALYISTADELSRKRLAAGGMLMGQGIAAMHYTGMAALKMHPAIVYSPGMFWASIGIAVTASWAALWITFKLRDGNQSYVLLKRCAAGLVMGTAIAGMHYTAMGAAIFQRGAVCGASKGVDTTWLSWTVAGATVCVLSITLLYSMLDARYDLQTFQLEASREQARLHESLAIANERLLVMATEDGLTGLPNRTSLVSRLEQMLQEAHDDSWSFALMFMDLDGFKTVNDSLGHSSGDKLLQLFASQLRASVRREDMVARLSGDEFVVLLDGLGRQSEIEPMVKDILERLKQDFFVHEMPLRITVSIGIATYPQDGRTVEELLKNADTAMYAAKQDGRNTFRFFHSSMSESAMRAMLIQRGLSEAIPQNHLRLHFQPKFNGLTQEMAGAEALIRWHHSELGEVPPLEFIPIAERTGLIVPIGDWVIREACRHIRRWKEEGLPLVKIAINLAWEQVKQPHCVENVQAITASFGIEPEWLMFEITETTAMQDTAVTAETIARFHGAGFDVALDDFGTGYSSLAYLQQFRVKQLKIDRSFTEGLDEGGEQRYAMVSAIVELAHALGMIVVVEGVEKQSQMAQLKRLRCDEVQGFLFAEPLDSDRFEDLLREWTRSRAQEATERDWMRNYGSGVWRFS